MVPASPPMFRADNRSSAGRVVCEAWRRARRCSQLMARQEGSVARGCRAPFMAASLSLWTSDCAAELPVLIGESLCDNHRCVLVSPTRPQSDSKV
ncbi:hypothetical protein RRG08_003041 [Elysia crispata]|uniref:Uncharacterized protein n=1 Tax=Elysia crispata TaxID=231223 RepID=A0AAE1B693_9GAST|nr:hypothetical protein RRG08_003041 [Elysia crispata]